MTLANTAASYGLLARTLHWLTALLIFVAFPLGYLANNTPLTDETAIARVFTLFSWHKTIGIVVLLIGLARIGWSLTQPRPAPMPHARWEHVLAAFTHWTLTIALIAVPLTGWLAHSASPGLSPIRLPVPQALPFVPATPESAAGLGGIHWVATKLLAVAILLHIAGALKHALIDRDGTLARMTRGTPGPEVTRALEWPAVLAALAVWAAALSIGAIVGLTRQPDVVEETREWPFTEGRITITDATGETLAEALTFSFLLALDPDANRPDKGTLDITIPLDALDGPGVDRILAAAPFPLLTYFGTVSGTPPVLTSDGALDLAGATESAQFTVTTDATGATVTGTAPLPGSSGLTLVIEARTLRN